MRWSTIWIVPRAIASVDQLFRRSIPRLQFDQAVEPNIDDPAGDIRPDISNLLLASTPGLLGVVEELFDRPSES
jgi:hypothetical protein